jgi:hypothetical protein
MSADFIWERLKERQHFENLGIDGTIILQWIGRRGLCSSGCCEHGDESSGSINAGNFLISCGTVSFPSRTLLSRNIVCSEYVPSVRNMRRRTAELTRCGDERHAAGVCGVVCDGSVRVLTGNSWTSDELWFDSRQQTFLQSVQTGSGAHPTSYQGMPRATSPS